MRLKKIAVRKCFLMSLLASGASALTLPIGALAQSTCRSASGGYCVNLATIYSGIEFLGDVNGIADLMVKLYTWGLGVTALIAFIMIVFGGIEYLTAGDNQGRATDARRRITNAVMGLALALLSYLILFTINPDLVKGWTIALPKLEVKIGETRTEKRACGQYGAIPGIGNEWTCTQTRYDSANCDSKCIWPQTCIPANTCYLSF